MITVKSDKPEQQPKLDSQTAVKIPVYTLKDLRTKGNVLQ